jgi:ribosomal protein L16/L10AE
MGKGKGNIQYLVSPVSSGRILFEIRATITPLVAKDILLKSSKKLPILTKFIMYKNVSFNYN